MSPRLAVMALLLAVFTACSTSRGVRLATGPGAPLEHRSPTLNKSVKVSAAMFEQALTRVVLEAPLPLRPAQHEWLVRASYPTHDKDLRWQRLMNKSFGGLCDPGQRKETCLSLLDDVVGLSEWDKLGVAMGLSLDPMRESISRAVKDTLAPQLFYSVIATGLVSWAVLAANPEPVFTKAAAIISALLLSYLGVETFLELVDASREMKRATDKATTLQELEVAGEHFAERVGPELARVFVLAATIVVSYGMSGGTAWLASRLSMLPRFPEAAVLGASQIGIHLANVGQVRAVAVVGNIVTISLPATAVAVVAQGTGAGQAPVGLSGQEHHVISRRIAQELDKYPSLRGRYTARDPRFVARAADKPSHNGYQQWHRDVDNEVIQWLIQHSKATPAEFEAFLRQIYSRPEMRARFPHGF